MNNRSKGKSSPKPSFARRPAAGSRRDTSVTIGLEQENDMEYAKNVERTTHITSIQEIPTEKLPNMSPSFAAAMLSLPWPPPETEADAGGSEADDSSDADLPKKTAAFGKMSQQPKKNWAKKRSTPSFRLGQKKGEEEYRPFAIPKFKEVHTNWPGFDHEPITNWKEKYMIAKPYPKDRSESEAESKIVLNRPSYMTSNNNSVIDFDGGQGSYSKIPTNKSKTTSYIKGCSIRPRVFVDRVPSCIR